MEFTFKGIAKFGKEKMAFTKKVVAKSKKHALDKLYALFGSLNGIKRSLIKVESVEG